MKWISPLGLSRINLKLECFGHLSAPNSSCRSCKQSGTLWTVLRHQSGLPIPKARPRQHELYPNSGRFLSSTRLAAIQQKAKKDCFHLFHHQAVITFCFFHELR
ncbi:hypothetical protein SRHO_G00270100 [Serrasalmus rhombeus]